jgi:GxxExxY protein
VHPKFARADELSRVVIGAAIEVHRLMGPGLLESIYQKCLTRELELRGVAVRTQDMIQITYKDVTFAEELRFDLLIDGCLLVEIKCVQELHNIHKAQLLSYMKLLNVPLGLLINFYSDRVVDGVTRMVLRDANR